MQCVYLDDEVSYRTIVNPDWTIVPEAA